MLASQLYICITDSAADKVVEEWRTDKSISDLLSLRCVLELQMGLLCRHLVSQLENLALRQNL